MSFGKTPPKLRTLLRSLVPAVTNRGRFCDVRTFALFIGHARSGSSLVGSLLNAHRHALIAHELNVMHFVKRRFPRSVLYWLLYQQDQAFERAGRQWTGYDYAVRGQWQGRSERLLVIGDKDASGASRLLGRRPELLDRLRRTVRGEVKLIHIVRHPLDNIATIHHRQKVSLPDAIEQYFLCLQTNARLVRDNPADAITLHHEDLVHQSRVQLQRLCGFLDLDAPAGYVEACAATIFSAPRRTRVSVAWPEGVPDELRERCQAFSFLQRYLGSDVWDVDGETCRPEQLWRAA